jgi:hypothetical protein
MFKCPHCSEGIDNAVSTETLNKRLQSKTQQIEDKAQEIEMLKKSVSDTQDQVSEYSELKSKYQQLLGDYERESQSRFLAQRGVSDQRAADAFRVIYKSETTGQEEAPTFEGWLEEHAVNHPLLSPYLTTEKKAEEQPKPKPLPNPNSNVVAEPEQRAPKVSSLQIKEYLMSREYRSLPLDKRREKLEELKKDVGQE